MTYQKQINKPTSSLSVCQPPLTCTILNHAISEGNSLQPVISSFIEKDKDTGKSFLKIPVPDEDTISKAVSTFGRLLQGLRK